ncbi:MAG: aminodeoxychorismate lyase [Rhodanobacteraceae bacterium]|nr:aminodeoxychorismate lyase [Xanthomonadales bacterium]MCP5478217.1 aminodeoxychorismate lyase [Rhodanobacteraceae bacterium]HPF72905.1 aminodeoxychorismate lyase [Xanthomonadaceae bacterium]HRX99998.1 aminodeoxychorismate lyase [Xanthomonadaceae bacterium]
MNSFDPRNAPLLAWVDGVESDVIDIADRGLAYGDGLFETFRVINERPLWWDRHLARLQRGAQVLGIELPNPTRMHIEALNCCEGAADGVLKLILTRGSSGRGYRPGDGSPTRILSLHPSPTRQDSITAIRCEARLATQPLLAGLKHLNRLEQVLAARECQQANVDEGLLFDGDGRLVSAVAGNVFLLRDGEWLTPTIDRCGVAGICREWLLENLASCRETALSDDDVKAAEAVFVCNSVRGILPVSELDGRALPLPESLLALRDQLRQELPPLPAMDCPGRA